MSQFLNNCYFGNHCVACVLLIPFLHLLWTTLAIPSEAKDVLPGLKILGDFDIVDDLALTMIVVRRVCFYRWEEWVHGPHGSWRECALCCSVCRQPCSVARMGVSPKDHPLVVALEF